jgi:uncharacterized membrane protein
MARPARSSAATGPGALNRRQRASAALHLSVSTLSGVVVGAAVAVVAGASTGLMAGWVALSVVFLGWTWTAVRPMDSATTAVHATLEDPGRRSRDLIVLALSAVSLVTVVLVIFRARDAGIVLTLLGILAIVSSWAVLHTVFTLRYAEIYYTAPERAIDFHHDDDPTYRDFAYVGFTIGMTFQVSDTDIVDAVARATVLRHALLSFAFNTVVIAVSINLVAGLSN